MSTTFEKRWLMFLLRPADLLALLGAVSNPLNKFAAGSLPPDVRIEDVFYDEGRNFLGLMLESQYFEAVEVEKRGELLSAAWPRALFTLENDAHGAPHEDLWSESFENTAELEFEAVKPFIEELQDASTRDFRLRALTFSGENLLQILRADAARQLPVFPSYPPQTRVLGAIAQEPIASWVLFLEHPDFEPCQVGQENDLVHVEILGDSVSKEEKERVFRIGLPGARLQRRLEVDPNL